MYIQFIGTKMCIYLQLAAPWHLPAPKVEPVIFNTFVFATSIIEPDNVYTNYASDCLVHTSRFERVLFDNYSDSRIRS